MKKTVKLFSTIFAGLLFMSSLFTSCDNGLLNDQKDPVAQENNDKAYISVSSVSIGCDRTVLPFVDPSDFKYIVFSGTNNGRPYNFYKRTGENVINGLLENQYELMKGEWSFVLRCSTYTSNYDYGKATYYTKSITMTVGAGTNVIDFILEPQSFSTYSGNGNYELTLNLPSYVGTITADLCKIKTDGTEENYSSPTVTFENNKAVISGTEKNGNYLLVVNLYADEEKTKPLGTYREIVKIVYDLTSRAERTLNTIENLYDINFELNGGELNAASLIPSSYTRFTETVSLPSSSDIVKFNESDEEMYFVGWFDNESLSGDPVTEIESGSAGNKTYWAKWVEYCKVTFNGDVFAPKKVPCGIYIDVNELAQTKNFGDYSLVVDSMSVDGTVLNDKILLTGDITVDVEDIYYYCTYDKISTLLGASDLPSAFTLKVKPENTTLKLDSETWKAIRAALTSETPAYSVILDISEYTDVSSAGFSATDSAYYAQAASEVILNSDLTSLSNYLMDYMKGIKRVTIPSALTTIPNYCFRYCTALEEFDIPEKVTTLGEYSFNNCTALKKLTIPASLTTTSYSVFSNTEISELHISDINAYARISRSLPGYSKELKVYLNDEVLTSITLDETVTKLSSGVFKNWGDITEVSLPQTLISVGDYAFAGCKNLTSIVIPDSVESLGMRIFAECASLKEMTVPYTSTSSMTTDNYQTSFAYTYFGGNSFEGSYKASVSAGYSNSDYYIPEALKKITVTKSRTLYSGTFSGLSRVEEISFVAPNIPSLAFENCSSLKKVVISGTSTSISGYAFKGCSSLQEITIPSTVTEIKQYAFDSTCTSVNTMYLSDVDNWIKAKKTTYPFQYSTAEGKKVYLNNELLTSVIIPDSITEIPAATFHNWESLKQITIPETITAIGSNAFKNCSGINRLNIQSVEQWCKFDLSTEEYNPLWYTSYADVYLNGELLETLEIPESITKLKKETFRNWGSLKKIIIPSGVTLPRKYSSSSNVDPVFTGCSKVEYFSGDEFSKYLFNSNVPETLKFVEITAESVKCSLTGLDMIEEVSFPNVKTFSGKFVDCYGIKNLYITNLEDWINCGISSWTQSPFVDSKAESCTIYLNGEPIEDLVIPEGVTKIPSGFFYKYNTIKTLKLNSSLTSIGTYAFEKCTALTSIDFNNASVKLDSSFLNCSSLESVTIPASVVSVGSSFQKCSNLKTATYESMNNFASSDFMASSSSSSAVKTPIEKITFEGGSSFSGCGSMGFLKEVVFKEACELTSIPSSAFSSCTSLEKLTMCSSITGTDSYSFSSCTNLKHIYIKDIDTWLNMSFNSHPFAYSQEGHIYDLNGVEFTEITIPEGVTELYTGAFYYLASLIKLNVESILNATDATPFTKCANLTQVHFASEDALYAWAQSPFNPFSESKAGAYYVNGQLVTDVVVPDTVSKIGSYAFAYLTDLKTISIPGNVEIDKYVLSGCSSLTEAEFPLCSDGYLSSIIDTSSPVTKLTINGGPVKSINVPSSLTELIITENVASIREGAIGKAYSSSWALQKLTIGYLGTDISTPGKYSIFNGDTPSTLTELTILAGTLADSAFSNKSISFALTLGEAITSIPTKCFYMCTKLSSITCPGVTNIGSSAFYGATALKTFTCNENTIIGEEAFYQAGLTSVDLSGVISIETKAFYECTSLKSVEIPESVETIGDKAFMNCKGLTSVVINSSSTGKSVFESCYNIKTIECNAINVNERAFVGLSNVTKVTLNNTVNIGTSAFAGVGTVTTTWSLPETIISVGDCAFQNTNGVSVIPDSIENVGKYAFYGTYITKLPDSLKTMDTWSFANTQMTSVKIPDCITEIPEYCFRGNTRLSKIELNKVESIGEYAFSNCVFVSLTIPSTVTHIGSKGLYSSYFQYPSVTKTIQLEDNTSKWKGYNYFTNRYERFNPATQSAKINDFFCGISDGSKYYYDSVEKITDAEYAEIEYTAFN